MMYRPSISYVKNEYRYKRRINFVARRRENLLNRKKIVFHIYSTLKLTSNTGYYPLRLDSWISYRDRCRNKIHDNRLIPPRGWMFTVQNRSKLCSHIRENWKNIYFSTLKIYHCDSNSLSRKLVSGHWFPIKSRFSFQRINRKNSYWIYL